MRGISSLLFGPQRGDWIYIGGTAGRQKTGEQSRNCQHQTGSEQRERIARTYIVQDLSQDSARGQGKQNSDANGERGLHRALAHDQSEDVLAMCAERHSNADLARPARHRISLYPIDTDDRQQQRNATKHPEKNRAQLNDPKIWRFLHQIDVRSHLQQGQVWVNLAERLPKHRHHRDYSVSIFCPDPNVKINLAVVALGQRHKQPANNGVVLDVVPMFADDTDDLQVVRRAILWRLGIADTLTDGILVWEKFRRHFFVNDSDATRILVLAFGLRKIAAAQQLHAEGIEITEADRSVERIDTRVRRFGIVRHRVFRTNDPPGVSEIGIR